MWFIIDYLVNTVRPYMQLDEKKVSVTVRSHLNHNRIILYIFSNYPQSFKYLLITFYVRITLFLFYAHTRCKIVLSDMEPNP